MRIEVPHELDLKEVIERMHSLTTYWREKYAVDSRWKKSESNLAASYLGVAFEATLSVEPGIVVLDGPDPGILLRHQAVSYVKRKLTEYLHPEFRRHPSVEVGRDRRDPLSPVCSRP